jgi:predicted RNA-binding protein with PUA-like domain
MFDSPEELLQKIRLGEDAARNNLKDMRSHDPVVFYHSQQELTVVGLMGVSRRAYSDPTSADPQWLTCDFAPIRNLARPVSLAEIKADSRLTEMGLVRQPRLAVMPLTAQEFDIVANELANKPME